MKIKKNDNVIVITGKDKNKTGKVIKVLPKEDKVIVENVNIVTKHIKKHLGGGRIQFEKPIHISNVMMIDPSTNKKTRIGYVVEQSDGKQVKRRIAKKSKKVI